MQVDTVLSRLTALKERIEGTEALIEIDLDHRRNELVAFDLVRRTQCMHCLCHVVCACCLCMQFVYTLGSRCAASALNKLPKQHIEQVMMCCHVDVQSAQTL